jgi:hypothetical protein
MATTMRYVLVIPVLFIAAERAPMATVKSVDIYDEGRASLTS